NVPAEPLYALRHRFDHVESGDGGGGIEQGKPDPSDTGGVQLIKYRVVHVGMQYCDTASAVDAKLGDGIHGDAIVRAIDAWADQHDTFGLEMSLQLPIIAYRGMFQRNGCGRMRREPMVINMYMRIAAQWRDNEG